MFLNLGAKIVLFILLHKILPHFFHNFVNKLSRLVNIYSNLEQVPHFKNPVITIGTFDGVHLGHKKVLSLLKAKAKEVGGESVVFTFHPHPRMVLHPNDHHLELIQTIEERTEKLAASGIDHLIVFPFTKEFSRMTALSFVRDILVNKLNLHTLVIGYDHHFGRNREGSKDNLDELAPLFGFKICEIEALSKGEVNISSTKIRQAIKQKDFKQVTAYLGSPFQFSGVVVAGDQIGATLGYPTANLKIEHNYKIIPPNGVYAVKVNVLQKYYFGMLNIGERPTVTSNGEKRIEVHLLDFKKDLYGEKLKVDVIDYIRPEISFDSKMDLVNQIVEDEKNCRYILGPSV